MSHLLFNKIQGPLPEKFRNPYKNRRLRTCHVYEDGSGSVTMIMSYDGIRSHETYNYIWGCGRTMLPFRVVRSIGLKVRTQNGD